MLWRPNYEDLLQRPYIISLTLSLYIYIYTLMESPICIYSIYVYIKVFAKQNLLQKKTKLIAKITN